MSEEERMKEYLLQHDDEFRRLDEKHKKYDKDLREIADSLFLTPDQERGKIKLKKMKLLVKDQMQEIIDSYCKTIKT